MKENECAVARSETKSKEGECLNCNLLSPTVVENVDADDDSLVEEIADIARWERAGFRTDWSLYDFQIKHLFTVWIDAERIIGIYQQARIANQIEYQGKILKAAHGIKDG
ncbi:MAG TPA: hypothetical protein VNI84_08695 [Pyrinomonadaceae bacterium]|nr:hypothetical protein [Pyrinomonadaceae bacterium]